MANGRKVIVIGSGPAGYTAGIYLARAGLAPLILTGENAGGQLMLTTEIENFPGFPQGIRGPELIMKMREQAERFGAEVIDKKVSWVDFKSKPFKIGLGLGSGQGEEYLVQTVVIATGAEAIPLNVPGEKEFIGRGVSVCAVCDAPFFRNKVTVVVGGGDVAMEEALALAKVAQSVAIIHRRDQFRASKAMQKKVLVDNKDKIEVWWNSEIKEIKGEGKVQKIVVYNNKKCETKEIDTDGIFVAIGHKPATEIFGGKIELDEKGYVKTGITYPLNSKFPSTSRYGAGKIQNSKLWLEGYPTMTSIEGVFAAGDVVDFRYKQAVTAAGLGTMAALDAEKWLENST